jgi:hypothetical protein
MSENNTQRPSPSSPQEQAEPHLEAEEGLDMTASSFAESLFLLMSKHLVKNKEWLTPEIGYWAGVVEQQARGTFDVLDHYSNVRKAVEEL